MTPEGLDPDLIGTMKIGSQDVSLRRTDVTDEDVIDVPLDPTDDKSEVYSYAERAITYSRWWTWEYWQKKGLPKEQFELTDGQYRMTLYNYGDFLDPRHLTGINRVLGIFSGIRDGEVFKHINHILIDDVQPMNGKSGELANGRGLTHARALTLYSNAFADVPNRVTEKVFNLVGTFVHELAHGLPHVMLGEETQDMAINKWRIVGNWYFTDEVRELAGGWKTTEVTTEPARCVTGYTQSDADEDMAESMVAALFDQEKLDSEKLQFLQNNFPFDPNKQSIWETQAVSDIRLPVTPSGFKVRFRGRRMFRIISREE